MSIDDRVSQIEAELKVLSQKRKALISELRSVHYVGTDTEILEEDVSWDEMVNYRKST